jgi:hypothetical protein
MTVSWMGLFLKLFAYTGAVVVLMLGVYWALRRQMMGQLPTQALGQTFLKQMGITLPAVAPSPLRVLARTSLEPRKTLYVIAYDDGQGVSHRILLASTPEGVTLLSTLASGSVNVSGTTSSHQEPVN